LTPAVEVDTPVVSTVHTSVVEDAKQIDSLDPRALANQLTTRVSSRRLIEAQSKSASAIATVAHSVKDELAEHFDISDVQVVGNGVNLSEFDGESDGGSESFGLFVGRLSYRKGIEDLIEAWERLPTEDRIPLKIVGKGPLREQLEKRISETALEEDIEFRGHVPRSELVRLYKQAELCMVPSHYEGLPTVLLEPMAARAPVVATAVSGALDVIEDGENGLLAPARDPDALRDAIQELLHDAEYRDRLATNGRDTIEREYTWEAVTDRYLDIYEESIS
jgi:glycosyltransferase involved in cell wall biosynthesis